MLISLEQLLASAQAAIDRHRQKVLAAKFKRDQHAEAFNEGAIDSPS